MKRWMCASRFVAKKTNKYVNHEKKRWGVSEVIAQSKTQRAPMLLIMKPLRFHSFSQHDTSL